MRVVVRCVCVAPPATGHWPAPLPWLAYKGASAAARLRPPPFPQCHAPRHCCITRESLHQRCITCIKPASPASNLHHLHQTCITCIRPASPASDLLDCGSENHRGDSRAATCRRCCVPWVHAEPPTRKRSWDLAARSSLSSLSSAYPERFALEAPPTAASRAGARTATCPKRRWSMNRHSDSRRIPSCHTWLMAKRQSSGGEEGGLAFVYQRRPQRQLHHLGRSTSALQLATPPPPLPTPLCASGRAPRWSGANG